jgi:hypothetical protein
MGLMSNRRTDMRRALPLIPLAFAAVTWPAEAYIGPGAGISLLGAFWALILAVVTAVGFVVWYPLRRMFRRPATANRKSGAPVGSRDEPRGERHAA